MKKINFITFIATLFVSDLLYAAEKAPALFVNFGGGLTTHKSEFVESNDTSYSYNYAFGVHAGSNEQLTMAINTSIDKTTFALNTSTIENSFQDSVLQYSMGPFYLGAIVSQTKMLVTRVTDAPVSIDAIGTGFGGALGACFDIGRTGNIFLDIKSVTTSTVKEVNQQVFTIGSRTDIAIGGTYAITRSLLDGIVGLRQRTYTVSLDGTAFAEKVTTTWFGFAMNVDL